MAVVLKWNKNDANSSALPNKFITQCVPITLTLYGLMLRTIKIDSNELYVEAERSNATGSPQDKEFWDLWSYYGVFCPT